MALDLGGALLFVVGCFTFYEPTQYTLGVTFFLFGSVLMLMSVAGRALLEHGPSE
ncbi:MAG TPA: YrhK family protein [Acidimicrobiia bacterium]